MINFFCRLIMRITGAAPGSKGLSGCGVVSQFTETSSHPGKRMNAAFLIVLSGREHPFYSRARQYLKQMAANAREAGAARFYLRAVKLVLDEAAAALRSHPDLRKSLAHAAMSTDGAPVLNGKTQLGLWRFFFPEGVASAENPARAIRELRLKRKVRISRPNPDPVKDPCDEMLFTSNILITLPLSPGKEKRSRVPEDLLAAARKIAKDGQKYFYDHPVPLNAPPEKNEVLHGLKALDRAVHFEKERGVIGKKCRLRVLLSLSATHARLDEIAAPYLRGLLGKKLRLSHLDVYLFTEADTRKLVRRVLLPALGKNASGKFGSALYRVFGVTGEYGRHYSFLKAVAALWQVAVDDKIKATFKIDLDQVFPQEKLVKETGKSALELFKNPLWGAMGRDDRNRPVELGMIAGSLVDKKDIRHSPFLPDAKIPDHFPAGPASLFFSALPRAVSTHAEMAGSASEDKRTAHQRFHILGGVNGILVKSLRQYRPFTPTFISRAEDQAYLISSLFSARAGNLRCLNQPGLVMRHDKDTVAGHAVETAEAGRGISELLRLFQFSGYARALAWGTAETKDCLDPFTGCFISPLPATIALLRFSLYIAECFKSGSGKDVVKGLQFQALGVNRLGRIATLTPRKFKDAYLEEKRAWDAFYHALDRLEKGLSGNDPAAEKLQKRALKIISDCKPAPEGNG